MGDVEVVRYTYRLRPGVAARRVLDSEAGMARWVWNQCVATDRDCRAEGVRLSYGQMSAKLTVWRSQHDWLSEGSQGVQQQTVRAWYQARQASFNVRRRQQPTFHARHRTRPSVEYTRNKFAISAGRLCPSKCPPIPVVWSRDLPNPPSSVRVYRDAVGDWWASFVVEREPEKFPEADSAIGIDWGVRVVATTTAPLFDLPHAEHGRKAAKRLAHYQRQMFRRMPAKDQPGSKRHERAKQTVAKAHRKVVWQRQDTARKWARRVVENHEQIAVEDFKPKFLAKSKMAKKSADATIGATKRILIEYGQRAGRNVVLVPAAYTTMTCSECGTRTKDRLGLEERIFRCDGCGHTADRDRNAARTILAAAGFNGASADCVSHDPPSGNRAA